MADEARRFVDDQQVGVFVEDGEQVFQARGILTTDGHGWTRIFKGENSEAVCYMIDFHVPPSSFCLLFLTEMRRNFFIGLALAGITLAIYWPAGTMICSGVTTRCF